MKALIFTFISCSLASAEYRVYQYLLKNKVEIQDQPKSILTLSTLPPQSFQAYHGGDMLVSVDLLRTWICPGYTGDGQKLCDSPYKRLSKKGMIQ